MSVYSRTIGQGPDLVMVHGWGLHGAIWGEVAERLGESFRLTLVDLPGHGNSPTLDGEYSLPALARAVTAVAPPRAYWLGWSLGGLVAATVALQAPERVTKLALMATNPKFVRSEDWPCGMLPDVLTSFSTELERNYHGTLMRFLMLQAKGSEDARAAVRVLRERLMAEGEPEPSALRGGLEILQGTDLRPALAGIACPTLLLFGRYDVLVPVRVAGAVQALLNDARVRIVDGAGHAPFISHPQEFVQTLSDFLHE